MATFTRIDTAIPGVCIIEPPVFGDERGFFLESWSAPAFAAIGISVPFVQDNHSLSRRGVLRGLHWQQAHTQAKLVRVISGAVFDVAVDIRRGSPHFGQWAGCELSAANKRLFFVPAGFAHGFVVLSETAEFCYKCSDIYDPGSECGLHYDDPQLAIDWHYEGAIQLSAKDAAAPSLATIDQNRLPRFEDHR